MTELSIHARTALSYLDDVERRTDALDENDNHLLRQSEGYEILRGDLRLARQEAMQADASEQSYLNGLCYFHEGRIKWSIARGHGKFYALAEGKRETRRFLVESGEAFAQAVSADPRPLYQYNLGLIYAILDRKEEAVKMFEHAANGDDPTIAIEARKEMGRIGPVRATPIAGAADGAVAFVRKKSPDWSAIRSGVIALIVGIVLSGFLIGIPIALFGIFMVIKGFVVGLDA